MLDMPYGSLLVAYEEPALFAEARVPIDGYHT